MATIKIETVKTDTEELEYMTGTLLAMHRTAGPDAVLRLADKVVRASDRIINDARIASPLWRAADRLALIERAVSCANRALRIRASADAEMHPYIRN